MEELLNLHKSVFQHYLEVIVSLFLMILSCQVQNYLPLKPEDFMVKSVNLMSHCIPLFYRFNDIEFKCSNKAHIKINFKK